MKVEVRQSSKSGFSLVEVVIALGILATMLIGIAVIFSSLLESSRHISNSDQSLSLMGTLNESLQERNFETVYGWVKEKNDLFLYAFKSGTNPPVPDGSDYRAGDPAPEAAQVFILRPSLRPASDNRLAAEIAAMEGPLYRIILLPMKNNPGGVDLPDFEAFTNAYLSLEAVISQVPSRSTELSAEKREVLRVPIAVNR